jgi:hypothetical protein
MEGSVGEGWGRTIRGLSIAGVLALTAAGLAALPAGCGSSHPADLQNNGSKGSGAAASCTAGKQDCPCSTPGQQVACGKVVTNAGDYVTCQMGNSTCTNGEWSACVGSTIIEKSTGALTLGATKILSLTSPCGNENVCDPNPQCTQIIGVPGMDVDAALVYESDSGVTLVPPDAAVPITCVPGSLQCDVVTCTDGGTTSITGSVTDPAGNNPLYGVTVYIPVFPSAALPPFSPGVTCDTCGGAASLDAVAVTTTATDGTFTLNNVPSGSGPNGGGIPIVVQSGKWRRVIVLDSVMACQKNQIASMDCTASDKSMCTLRLPQSGTDGYNIATGQYNYADMPQMAMVTGSADPLECILVKAGISLSEFSSYNLDVAPNTGHHHVHFYQSPNSPGTSLDPKYGSVQTGDVLWLDAIDPKSQTAPYVAPHYDYYDVVLDACEGSAIDKEALYTKKGGGKPYQNLIDYTDIGGRAFLTHFSYVWVEYPSLYGGYASASDNWSGVANWVNKTGTTDTQDPLDASVYQGFPKGIAFASWLENVGASPGNGQLTIHEGRQDLTTVGANTQYWMTAHNTTPPFGKSGNFDPHFTFNTQYGADAGAQCGRVVFSDFHVTADALVGNGNPKCYDTASCGFGQTCTGSPGMNGTCAEPCATSADCADNTYTCNGATVGTCQPAACTPGNTTYSCTTGTCNAAHSACLCTNNDQCASGYCVNSGQCSASCTGTGNQFNGSCCSGTGTPLTDGCQADSVTSCTLTTNFSCSTSLLPLPALNSPLAPTACLCVEDSQCASGKCSNANGQCTLLANGSGPAACNGTTTAGTYDTADCEMVTASLLTTASCTTTLSPTPVVNGASPPTACLCAKDSDCSSGKCGYVTTGNSANAAACGSASNCSGGTTNLDSADCAIAEPVASPVEGCTKGGCNGAAGACTVSGATCYCFKDSQCPGGANGTAGGGHCVSISGENSVSCGANCTGSGSHDAFNCELAAPSIPATATGATYACPSGHTGGAGSCDTISTPGQGCATSNAQCWCVSNSQCTSGECLTWSGCGGGTGTSAAQCVSSATQGSNQVDDYHCVLTSPGIPTTPTPNYACPTGEVAGNGAGQCVNKSTSPASTTTCSSTTPCWCTQNNQCVSGECVTWAGCTGGSGTGGANCVSSAGGNDVDDFNCVLASPGIATTPTPGYTCPIGEVTGQGTGKCANTGSSPATTTTCTTATPCYCAENAQCPSGQCLNWGGCSSTGTGTSACVTSAGGNSVDEFNCVLASPGIASAPSGTYTCAAGEAGNGAGKCADTSTAPASTTTCTGTTPCYCTQNNQCVSGECLTWAGCASTGTGTTSCVGSAGSNNVDGYNCVLTANGIPSTPVPTSSTFEYTPSNFTPTSYTPPAGATTDCNATYNSTSHTFTTGTCAGTAPTIHSGVTQSGGPTVDVLVFSSLTIASTSTLTLVGGNPVILAVYGTATINGTINASASATAPGAGGDNATYCNAPQTSQNQYDFFCAAERYYGGGGGGGRDSAGGTGNGGGILPTETSNGGASDGNSSASPLLGGCVGAINGTGGSAGGFGGGGVQISAATSVIVTGTITANGSAGANAADYAGGGGGGSGGDILLEGASVTTGTLSSNGGNGGTGGAGSSGATGGAGGTGATNNGSTQSTSNINGGSPSGGSLGALCTLPGGGGGGGGYGFITTKTHPCATSLSHAPVANTGNTACLCTNNADCASGLCGYVTTGANANSAGCGSATNCSGGTTNLDSANCAVLDPTATTYTCSIGAVNTSHTACLCTNNNQCASGKCGYVTTGTNANSSGCMNTTNCSGGTTGLDHANCAPLDPSTPSTFACTDGSIANSNDTACLCTNNSQCASGLCGYVTTGTNANSTACGGTTNCSGGTANLDTANCAILEPSTPTSYSCSTGMSNTSHTACLCTNNAQCGSGVCGYVTTGTNANSTGCGNATNCSGAATGLDTANCAPIVSSTSASAYCNTTLTPAPAANAGVCLCTADSDCGSGHCSNANGQCPAGNTCSGTTTAGTFDAADCQDAPTSGATGVNTYACAVGACEAGGATTTCGAATPCWCTSNAQCTSGECEQWNGCASGQCTSLSASTDGFHCILTAPGIPAAPTAAVYACPSIGSGGSGACESGGSTTTCASGSECWCTSNAQCPQSGQCLTWGGCTGGSGTSSTECVASAGSNSTDDYHCVLAAPGIPSGATSTSTSSCTTGFCSATISGDVCWCTADSQCGMGLCIPWSGCATGACNGSVASVPDDFHCAEPSSLPAPTCTANTAYSCALGQCNTTTVTCQCTQDSECPSGQCINTGQCAAGACSGTGLGDTASCVPANITNCSSNADCGGNASIEGCVTPGDGGTGLGICNCSASTNCGPGLTCQGGVCTGCTKNAQCKDLAHPATCNGGMNAIAGNCCNQADPAVGDAALTSSCGLNANLFPEACLQSTMSAQEKALEFMFFDLTSCVTPDAPPVATLGLKPETFTLDFTASCPSGSEAKWRQLTYEVTVPSPASGAGISISAQTGPEALEGGTMEAGALIPSTPLPVVINQQTTGSYAVLLDTTSGGLFNAATPPLVSQDWLRLTVTLDPTSDGNQSPVLNSWNVLYDCPASE